jgi:putative transposase
MGVLDRVVLQDEQWERISQHIIGDGHTRGLSPGAKFADI